MDSSCIVDVIIFKTSNFDRPEYCCAFLVTRYGKDHRLQFDLVNIHMCLFTLCYLSFNKVSAHSV